jgi:hypothetical protein
VSVLCHFSSHNPVSFCKSLHDATRQPLSVLVVFGGLAYVRKWATPPQRGATICEGRQI